MTPILPEPFKWRFCHANGYYSTILIFTDKDGVIAKKSLVTDNPIKEGEEFLVDASRQIYGIAKAARARGVVLFS